MDLTKIAAEQAHITATSIWTAVNEALVKHCPEKGPCFKESFRDKTAEALRVTLEHFASRATADLERQLAEATADRGDLDTALTDIYNELGCEHDNESGLRAVAQLRADLAAARKGIEELQWEKNVAVNKWVSRLNEAETKLATATKERDQLKRDLEQACYDMP